MPGAGPPIPFRTGNYNLIIDLTTAAAWRILTMGVIDLSATFRVPFESWSTVPWTLPVYVGRICNNLIIPYTLVIRTARTTTENNSTGAINHITEISVHTTVWGTPPETIITTPVIIMTVIKRNGNKICQANCRLCARTVLLSSRARIFMI